MASAAAVEQQPHKQQEAAADPPRKREAVVYNNGEPSRAAVVVGAIRGSALQRRLAGWPHARLRRGERPRARAASRAASPCERSPHAAFLAPSPLCLTTATVQDFLERYEVGDTVGVGGGRRHSPRTSAALASKLARLRLAQAAAACTVFGPALAHDSLVAARIAMRHDGRRRMRCHATKACPPPGAAS